MSENQNKATKNNEKETSTGKCSNCGKNEIFAMGLCQQCYKAQWYQKKKASMPPNPDKNPPGRPPVNGVKATVCYACGEKKIYARGVCYKCYKRAYQMGHVTKEGIDASYQRPRTTDPETGEKKICSYCGLNPVYANGLCRNCHARASRNGGAPGYKGRSYERSMKNERLLKERRELHEGEENEKE